MTELYELTLKELTLSLKGKRIDKCGIHSKAGAIKHLHRVSIQEAIEGEQRNIGVAIEPITSPYSS
jgi:hypothetical protein